MNSPETLTAADFNPARQNMPTVRLHGSWLLLARVAWMVLALLMLGLYLLGVVARLRQAPDPSDEALRISLAHLGLPALYAVFAEASLGFVLSNVVIAAVIFWRKSDEWIGLLSSLMLVLFLVDYLPSSLLTPGIGSWLFSFLDFLRWLCFFTFLLVFPDGRFVPRWTRYVVIAWVALEIPWEFFPTSPLSPQSWPPPLTVLVELGSWATGLGVQVYRYRRISTQAQRQQTKWVVFGIAWAIVIIFGGLLPGIFSPALNRPDSLYSLILNNLIEAFGTFLIPLSIGVAILRYRLWDIDILINRTLVYGTLTASVIGFYILVVGYLGALFRTGGNLVISLIATGLVAVLFQPLRGWLQRGINRLMYGQRDEPYAVVARLSRRLESTLAPEAVLSAIVETVAQALKLPYVAITLKQGDVFKTAAVYGSLVEGLLTLPLTYQSEPVGQLVLGPRQRGEAFTPADRQLLDDLARQVGIAAHAVRLTGDLQRSRERLVTAREEERRRLRRDLHDGLGPTLAALALKATTVSDLIPTNPEAATQLSNELYADIRATVGEIRRLVYELRPPRLDDLGLLGAIREAARQQSRPDGLQITVEAPERLPTLPAAVEVAAYRIAQEALTNVTRHAQARTCTVRLTLAGALQVEIVDDGVGMPPEHHAGVGLLSMRERATELGGACVIERNAAGGTRVCARLPIPSLPQEEANGAAARADC